MASTNGGSVLTTRHSARPTLVIDRPLLPNHRWRSMNRMISASFESSKPGMISAHLSIVGHQLKPEETSPGERQQIRQLPNARKSRFAEHLFWDQAFKLRQIELHCLGRSREVMDAEHDLSFVAADAGKDTAVLWSEHFV